MRSLAWELWKSPTAACHALVTAELTSLKMLHLKCCVQLRAPQFRKDIAGEGSGKRVLGGVAEGTGMAGRMLLLLQLPRRSFSEVGLVSSALSQLKGHEEVALSYTWECSD